MFNNKIQKRVFSSYMSYYNNNFFLPIKYENSTYYPLREIFSPSRFVLHSEPVLVAAFPGMFNNKIQKRVFSSYMSYYNNNFFLPIKYENSTYYPLREIFSPSRFVLHSAVEMIMHNFASDCACASCLKYMLHVERYPVRRRLGYSCRCWVVPLSSGYTPTLPFCTTLSMKRGWAFAPDFHKYSVLNAHGHLHCVEYVYTYGVLYFGVLFVDPCVILTCHDRVTSLACVHAQLG